MDDLFCLLLYFDKLHNIVNTLPSTRYWYVNNMEGWSVQLLHQHTGLPSFKLDYDEYEY